MDCANKMWEIMTGLLMFSGIIAFTGRPVTASCPIVMSSPSVVVRYGDPVSVNCSTSSTDFDGMGWEATYGGTGFEENVNFVTWTVEALKDWTIRPKCYITTPDDQCSERLSVTVYKTPDSVSISQSSHTGPMVEGKEYQLQCNIINVAPVHNLTVTWFKGDYIIEMKSNYNLSLTPVNESSSLTVTPHRDDNGAQILCETHLNLGPAGPNPYPTMSSKPHNMTVYYPPTFPSPEDEMLDVVGRDDVTLNCTATGNPPPVYSLSSDTMDKVEVQAVHIAPLLPGTYSCTASNEVGTSTKKFIVNETKSGSHPGTTAGIVVAVLLLFGLVSVCVVYHKPRNSPVAKPQDSGQLSRER